MLKRVLENGSKAKLVVVISAALLMTGCGIIKDRSNDHLKSEQIPPMIVPEELGSTAVGQTYRIPPIASIAIDEDSYDVPRPSPISDTRFEEIVKIQSYDNQSWILINKPPEEVWPRVRNILSRSSVPTTQVDASNGLMETSWIQFKDDEQNSHRFKISIEPAVQVNSTEVKMLHAQIALGAEDNAVAWPTASDSSSREKEMLEIVASALANDINSGTISLLAQSIGGEPKVEMVTPQVADPYLVIKLNYDRSWASVMYSLSRGGFSVTDKNQTAGVVYVDFQQNQEDEEDGWFSGWFGSDDDEDDAHSYQVLVKRVELGVEVRITDEDKTSLDSALSTKFLKVIRSNLS